MLNATVIFLDYFSVEMVVRVCVRSIAKNCELRSVELRSSSFHSVVCIGCYCSLSLVPGLVLPLPSFIFHHQLHTKQPSKESVRKNRMHITTQIKYTCRFHENCYESRSSRRTNRLTRLTQM